MLAEFRSLTEASTISALSWLATATGIGQRESRAVYAYTRRHERRSRHRRRRPSRISPIPCISAIGHRIEIGAGPAGSVAWVLTVTGPTASTGAVRRSIS